MIVAMRWPHLEVPVDDAHSVKIVDSIQDLADQSAGIFLCVKSFFHYPIKQLSTGYTWPFFCFKHHFKVNLQEFGKKEEEVSRHPLCGFRGGWCSLTCVVVCIMKQALTCCQ